MAVQVKDKTTVVSEFNPLQDFIVAKPVELAKGEEITESGLVLSMSQNNGVSDRPTYGEVISVGPETKNIKVGYTIYWPMQDGLDMEFKDGNFAMFRENSIIGYKV